MKHLARSTLFCLAAGTATLGLVVPGIAQDASQAASDDDMQIIADVTVIDAECRTTNTMFGAVFRYGEAHGIAMVDILPLGRRRQEFEAAMDRRLSAMTHDEICGSLQARYTQAFPEWFQPR